MSLDDDHILDRAHSHDHDCGSYKGDMDPDLDTVIGYLEQIADLAEENMKGQDGYEQIMEWADKALDILVQS